MNIWYKKLTPCQGNEPLVLEADGCSARFAEGLLPPTIVTATADRNKTRVHCLPCLHSYY